LQQWLTIIPRRRAAGRALIPILQLLRLVSGLAKVALLLEEIRFFVGDKDIDDADSGPLFQYRHGVVDEQELADILMR
jgi:hypothetical protein